MNLANKVAIITGASRGIGEAIALRFARAGAALVLAARHTDAVSEVASRICALGGKAVGVRCHVGNSDDIEALVARAREQFGSVDILVNNAGTSPYMGPVIEAGDEAIDKTFAVNLRGCLRLCQAVARQSEGEAVRAIVNISSIAGSVAAPDHGVYAMSKAALESLTKTLAVELGPLGIRVNAIAPGLIATRFSAALTQNDRVRTAFVNRTALGRLGKPEDVAEATLFLVSETAAYITGVILPVDGGWSCS